MRTELGKRGALMQKDIHTQRTKNEFRERLSNIKRVTDILCEHISDEGFMPASLNYAHYSACWFRDASMVSLSLSGASKTLGRFGVERKAEKAKNASARILSFCWSAIEKNIPRIENCISLPFQDKRFFKTENHLPARLGKDMSFFTLSLGDYRKSDEMDNSWLRQYDSLPLVLLATEWYIKRFGIDDSIKGNVAIIEKNWEKFLGYMMKVYKTPCHNAWEVDGHQLHSYTIASIEKGVDSLHNILLASGTGIKEEAKMIKARKDIDLFLKEFFIRDGVLYKAKDVFNKKGDGFESEPIMEVDASEIIAFNYFNAECVDNGVKEKTMEKIEMNLIGRNAFPIRYMGDTYFYGGRWILLGMEAARWYIANGRIDKGKEILEYLENRYLKERSMLPEQELVNTASAYDPGDYYKNNGNSVITDLAWSEGAYILAASEYLERTSKD